MTYQPAESENDMTGKHLRRGTVLPLFALLLVAILGFVAMAVDVGVLAIGITQCQNAADNAAMAGVRALNGNTGTNTSSATATAQSAAAANQILSVSVNTSDVTPSAGYLHYNSSTQAFVPTVGAPASPDNYNLMQVVVSPTRSGFFSKALGLSSFNLSATATAAYRPRDVAIVIDFSGSMNNETDLWNCESYLGGDLNTPNNTDSTFPQWGVYSPSFSPSATLQCTSSSDPLVGLCNITTSVSGVPAIVNDFYSNNRGSTAASAFTKVTAATNTTPLGDTYLTTTRDTTTTPGRTLAEITGSTSLTNTYNKNFATKGYKYFTNKTFNGYTEGPGYWGKTFFIWPPDALAANDWRKKFFYVGSASTPVSNNLALYDSGGNWQTPTTGGYTINYKAILAWIVSSPNPFPAQLRSGNILFYSSIPTDVPASAYSYSQLNSAISNADQRFWKEYIDFALGVWRDPYGNTQAPGSSTCSYGPDFACGDGTGVSITGPDSSTKYGGTTAFMAPTDNPLRPRHRFWFGPMTMIQYMLDTGLISGTSHDVSMVAAKLGIAGAITDIQNNHPNDMVSLIYYGRPSYAGDPTSVGVFDNPQVTLGRSYTSMLNALWYPANSTSADVRPWDTNGQNAPRAHGDYCSNTATSYGLMLAYNQLSGNAALQTSGLGGYGRKGAQRLVILETDGMANVATTAAVTNGGAYQSYYNIGTGNSYSVSGSDPAADAIAAATTICGLDSTTNNGLPGYSTSSKPVIIQCIAFGALFQPTADSSYSSPAISMLQSISTIGNSTFPSSASDPTNGYKWCIGTLSQRQTKLQQAFTTIMDSSVPIVLVK
jgi:Flp pilus assembly protein TadG